MRSSSRFQLWRGLCLLAVAVAPVAAAAEIRGATVSSARSLSTDEQRFGESRTLEVGFFDWDVDAVSFDATYSDGAKKVEYSFYKTAGRNFTYQLLREGCVDALNITEYFSDVTTTVSSNYNSDPDLDQLDITAVFVDDIQTKDLFEIDPSDGGKATIKICVQVDLIKNDFGTPGTDLSVAFRKLESIVSLDLEDVTFSLTGDVTKVTIVATPTTPESSCVEMSEGGTSVVVLNATYLEATFNFTVKDQSCDPTFFLYEPGCETAVDASVAFVSDTSTPGQITVLFDRQETVYENSALFTPDAEASYNGAIAICVKVDAGEAYSGGGGRFLLAPPQRALDEHCDGTVTATSETNITYTDTNVTGTSMGASTTVDYTCYSETGVSQATRSIKPVYDIVACKSDEAGTCVDPNLRQNEAFRLCLSQSSPDVEFTKFNSLEIVRDEDNETYAPIENGIENVLTMPPEISQNKACVVTFVPSRFFDSLTAQNITVTGDVALSFYQGSSSRRVLLATGANGEGEGGASRKLQGERPPNFEVTISLERTADELSEADWENFGMNEEGTAGFSSSSSGASIVAPRGWGPRLVVPTLLAALGMMTV